MQEQASDSGMRRDYLEKDKYYMAIARLSAKRSKDPDTQVGACIVNNDDRIVGIGYNGSPNKFPDTKMPWTTAEKDLYVCHAEMNAIVNKYAADVRRCRMYVTKFPCNECTKIIVQSGITKVIFLNDDPTLVDVKRIASNNIFEKTGVTFEKIQSFDDNEVERLLADV